MTPKQKRDRLEKIASERLALHPAAYMKFVGLHVASMSVSEASILCDGFDQNLTVLEAIDPEYALRKFDRLAIAYVDRWASENIPLPAPHVAPILPIHASNDGLSKSLPKNETAEQNARAAYAEAAARGALKAGAGQEPTASASAPATQAPAQDAAPPASDGPAPMTTGDIAHCFAGLRWNESQWRKPLGNKPKWLAECVAIPGQRGVSATRWNPVLIGAALVQRGHANARNVRAKFQSVEMLKPWLEAWKTYEADNLETA